KCIKLHISVDFLDSNITIIELVSVSNSIEVKCWGSQSTQTVFLFIQVKREEKQAIHINVGEKLLTNHQEEIISLRQLHIMIKHMINQVKEDIYCMSQDFYKNDILKLEEDIAKLKREGNASIQNVQEKRQPHFLRASFCQEIIRIFQDSSDSYLCLEMWKTDTGDTVVKEDYEENEHSICEEKVDIEKTFINEYFNRL
ncbi:hypothetical protein HPG69_016280, partial [Diceros bicornis minor]